MAQQLPNPDTYLNHLTPDQAAQFEVVRVTQIASLGAIVWDIFSFIPEDRKTLKQSNGLVTSICFVLTRILAAIYVSLWVTMSTHPVADYQKLMLATNIVCFFPMGITSLLFLRRVQTVYGESRFAYWFFSPLFVCSSISHVMLILGMEVEHIPGTSYCTAYKVDLFASVTYFMPGLFDTVVFFAICYKIAYQNHQHHRSLVDNLITRFLSTKSLPMLSWAVLQGGQQYYLVGVIFRLVAVVLMFTPSVPALYRPLILPPTVVVTASTVCRVHRLMVSAFHNPNGETTGTLVVSQIHFADSRPEAGKPTSSFDSGNTTNECGTDERKPMSPKFI